MLHALTSALLLVGCADAPACAASMCASAAWLGTEPGGELGSRFTSPLDVNGDGIGDVAAGAPFADGSSVDVGSAYAWSGTGAVLLEWWGGAERGLFGQAVATLPDLDGDGLADIAVSAPHDVGGGSVTARSPSSGRVLWVARSEESLGWHLATMGDLDGDGVEDIAAGEPRSTRGRVLALSGRTGEVLRVYDGASSSFGELVASISDQDADGARDLFVGAPFHEDRGAAFVLSSATGGVIRELLGEETGARFGDSLTDVPDVDGDGRDDLAVGEPYTHVPGQAGQVLVYSSQTGELLHRLVGTQPDATYGRMVARVLDLDEDGRDDLAIGAPWRRVDGMDRAGYFEIRSSRTMEVIASVEGTRANAWLGWHIVSAERMIDGTHRGVLVSSLFSDENGIESAGRIELYEFTP